ncbi:MAG: M24 family metallopeptidase [Gammaproteobacteria bacterium]|nr:M24 family metallopeptidase [Gammaproteobacteria bacterium]MDH4256849.1 M24 family metallopeptidase [Gammaproteobacteria bacterium]MDH5311705.1 M24 family metallopeptidase [Gammaproteobacteria bacterium]
MRIAATLALLLATAAAGGQTESLILPMRERAAVIDRLLEDRVQTLLPALMRRSGIDMWVIVSREYNEDPVIRTFLPSTWQSARRTTILLIYDRGGNEPLETLAVARYGVGDTFERAWDKELHGEQWSRLAELVAERDPKRIGLNYSDEFALADGISHTEYRLFHDALPDALRDRVVSAEALAIGWLETRSAAEMEIYPQICRIAHEIIAEGLSEAVIQPGVTTTNDVAWWYRDRIRELRLTTWFHPSVSIQRAAAPEQGVKESIEARHDDDVIRPGDLLHVDFGITYLRLNTDTQQHAYVLRPGEADAPEDLKRALARGNRLQDILTAEFKTGRSGNEILAAALAEAGKEGIDATIYTHPIGFHGHAAGPTIGLWDEQDGVPVRGDYPLYPDTAHSIELAAESDVPAWGRAVRIKLEEDAFFDGEKVWYIDGRQKAFHLVPRAPATQ